MDPPPVVRSVVIVIVFVFVVLVFTIFVVWWSAVILSVGTFDPVAFTCPLLFGKLVGDYRCSGWGRHNSPNNASIVPSSSKASSEPFNMLSKCLRLTYVHG